MSHRRAGVVSACAVLLWVGGAASASTLLRRNVQELSSRSDAVVRGTVKRVQSRWTLDRARIVTDIEIEVSETIKGEPPKTVVLHQAGGVVGEIGQKVSGLASFEQGEEVLVFLEQRPGKTFDVAGMAQGKYKIDKDDDGKDLIAIPERMSQTRLLDPSSGAPVEPSFEPIKLETLRAQIRQFKDAPSLPVRPRLPRK